MISLLTWARLGSRPAFSVSRARAELELDLVPRPLPRPRPSAVVEVAAASVASPPPCCSSRLEDLGLLSSDMSPGSDGRAVAVAGPGPAAVWSIVTPWPPLLTLRHVQTPVLSIYQTFPLLPSWILDIINILYPHWCTD